MENVRVLYKTENLIIIEKPCGIPSQPDTSGDKDAMTLTKEVLSSLSEKDELYIINRLDRVVGGLVLFARNKTAAAKLSALSTEEKINKEYLAIVSGVPQEGRLRNYLYKDARISKAFIADKKKGGAKEAILDLFPLSSVMGEKGEITLVKVKLHTGRYHQIRCQLSGCGAPIVGDAKYGSKDRGAHYPALYSHRLSFSAFGEDIDITSYPKTDSYPWNAFDIGGMK